MLEDDGFVPVGRVTLQRPAKLVIHFDRDDAKGWGPALYAFRIGGEVVRIGKGRTLKGRMRAFERDVSKAMSGEFQQNHTNPWEAFEWRRRLSEHGGGEVLARVGAIDERGALIERYNPPLCNDSQCALLRPPEARGVRGESGVALAAAYWQRLNAASASEGNSN